MRCLYIKNAVFCFAELFCGVLGSAGLSGAMGGLMGVQGASRGTLGHSCVRRRFGSNRWAVKSFDPPYAALRLHIAACGAVMLHFMQVFALRSFAELCGAFLWHDGEPARNAVNTASMLIIITPWTPEICFLEGSSGASLGQPARPSPAPYSLATTDEQAYKSPKDQAILRLLFRPAGNQA
jgi:hypothetical protein